MEKHRELFDGNLRITVGDLPERSTLPGDDELDRIFGGWGGRDLYQLKLRRWQGSWRYKKIQNLRNLMRMRWRPLRRRSWKPWRAPR